MSASETLGSDQTRGLEDISAPFHMVPHGSTWFHIGFTWFHMVPHGSIWFHMVPYGSIWFHNAELFRPYLAVSFHTVPFRSIALLA